MSDFMFWFYGSYSLWVGIVSSFVFLLCGNPTSDNSIFCVSGNIFFWTVYSLQAEISCGEISESLCVVGPGMHMSTRQH